MESGDKWGASGISIRAIVVSNLFIYINVDSGISSDASKFADDTKTGRVIRLDSDVTALQTD